MDRRCNEESARMLAYPAKVEAEGEGMVMLTLPDVPELVVVAGKKAEAVRKAPPVLDGILAGYAWQERRCPRPRGSPARPSSRPESIASNKRGDSYS